MPNYDGRNPRDVANALNYLESIIAQQKKFKIAVYSPKRTGRQNRFLHAIIGLISSYTGSDTESIKKQLVKEDLCKDIFYDGENSIGTKVISKWRSTKDLNTKECSVVISRLIFFASSELGLYIPDPAEYIDIMDEDTSHDWSAVDQFIFHVQKIQEQDKTYQI